MPPGAQPLVATAERLRIFALGCLGLMALALAAVLGLAAHAAIAANGPAIETLRLVGAARRLHRPRLHPAASRCAPPPGRCVGSARRHGAAGGAAAGERAGVLPRRHRPRRLALVAAARRSRRPPAPSPGRRPRSRPGAACGAGAEARCCSSARWSSTRCSTRRWRVMGILGAPLALWSVDGAYRVCRAYCRVAFFCLRVDLRPPGRGARRRCRRARCWSRPSTSRSSTS